MNTTSFNPERVRYFLPVEGKMFYGGVYLGTEVTAVHTLWTGACASDGQPIYQGDVVRTKPYEVPMLIEWDETFCRFVYTAAIRGELVRFPLHREWAEKNLVIMGNVLQSPELWPYLTKQ